MFFSQRRHFYWIICDKSRLNKVALAFLSKYFIYQFSFTHCLIYIYTDGFRECSKFFFTLISDIVSCKFLDGICHRNPFVRSFPVYLVFSENSFGCSIYCFGTMLQKSFGKVHHPVVILVCHIDFHCRKFRVVGSVHTFITEVFRKLIYTIKTTDYQSF